ncbi:GTPase ObgE [Peptoniphilus sp. KCTC 25270]|uniref:GTPase ObgE n=1 Tax=Peptoniphilus sp. KCTC 25270 TaxID=2897414 RepID=UPI001E4115AC|nr:GTPase ObgE [Peptoniphilus sp. KCTC 25270]MCD1146920.1 GTPase ObgE [Peptoniphilus sp. KCTC 25270]
MFVDVTQITVKAGKGGDGAVAWRREKYVPAGGPAGGDGGNGGSVIIKTDEGIHTLMDFRYKRVYKADNGEKGRNKKQFGAHGEDIILKVPVGTLVKDTKSGRVIVDLKNPNQEFIIAQGGKGGKGNARYATATRQAPSFAQLGFKGQEREITLELKLLADVGLLGFPNVGKSTLLSVISAARPKIANYHFTTLEPNLGVVSLGEEMSFVVADIPGLIEGAGEGVGLGHDFLRHVERTRVLIHVLDVSGSEGRDPIEDFYKINKELESYNASLMEKPQIIFANKMDIPGAEEGLKRVEEEFIPKGYKVFSGSAATTKNLSPLLYEAYEIVQNSPIEYETYDEEYVEEHVEEEKIIVRKEDDQYIVEGSYIERLLGSTYFDDRDSLRYFQENLRKNGVIDKLRELGIDEGESVYISGYEFEFFE